jgi:uncharacterized protein (TIGR00255 family)
MIKSMTGFGRGSHEDEHRSFTVEIKSVNHRYCDLNIKLPKNLISLEDKIRKTVQPSISRGKIDIFITQNTFKKEDTVAVFNESLGDSYFKCLKKIKERYNIDDDISVSLLAKFPDVINVKQLDEDIKELWDCIAIPLNSALKLMLEMRTFEGLKLQENIILKCENIKILLNEIEKQAPLVVVEYKDKLKERIKLLLDDQSVDESRIAMEVAMFADKACIDEEIVRLKSHLNQMKVTLDIDEPVGRKLDFIVQEMNRETNTIGSKANNLDIVHLVLNIKNEIEKIREQVQNVE